MPLNCDFNWGPPVQQQYPFVSPQNTCFQIYGTKRKALKNDQGNEDFTCKRQCHGVSSSGNVTDPIQDQHFGTVQYLTESQACVAVTDNQEEMEHSQVQDLPLNQHREPKQQTQEIGSDDLQFIQEMTMESNDYWCAPMSHLNNTLKMQEDLEDDRIRMESDYTPDPEQYRSSSAESVPPLGYDQTTSGRVRCYCRQNWPEMLGPTV
ncbi:uncharacterized protein [Ptychodera flava]|uniref:uncharacterized protein isoform X2 n=1 Tax=Ptychodera flava TaxID=63121 RepID=UPI00396A91EE